VDPCAIGGDSFRRRLTLVPSAAVWEQATEMQTTQADLAALKRQGEELQKQCADSSSTLKSINDTLKQLSSWVPQVDESLKGLQATIEAVGQRVTTLEAERVHANELRTLAPTEVEAQYSGKIIPNQHMKIAVPGRNHGRREFPHTPVNFELGDNSGADQSTGFEDSGYPSSRGGSYRSRPPKTEFPRFDGENPKWWKKVCEKYFDLYSVDHETWANFATMHFVGNAALWLQSYEAEHDVDGWEDLCVAVHEKFGRNKHTKYLQALERCKQTQTVEKYYQKFESIRHQVLVHNKHYDEAYFVTKFLNGLRSDIRKAIRLHNPRTVDAALTLAETQEELLDEDRPYNNTRARMDSKNRFSRTGFPGKGILSYNPEGSDRKQEEQPTNKAPWNDKLKSLKAQRRERGECFKCGEKFIPGHKCNKSVPLHIVEELMEVLSVSSSESEQEGKTASSSDESFMHISQCALAGTSHRKSIRLQGTIKGKQVLILIDSGSCGSFINSTTVKELGLTQTEVEPVTVQVADGGKTRITTAVTDMEWECQGSKFKDTFRVFSVPCYDIILGMDWLDACGKMWVDWPNKKMRFKHLGKRITLRGIKNKVQSCDIISAAEMEELIEQSALAQIVHLCPVGESYEPTALPAEIEQLLKDKEASFAMPTKLPPHRPFDHRIELMPGVQPVNLKPYRYSPQQKDEIERQLKEMIAQGIIKPSQSPFASPVLLVKKKDGSWRFCVDYRRLNAVTVKDRYPMPVVDELLDELAGAQFFSKLDLRSGYHQIRMKDTDEPKTAFKTHSGHFEFRVMPFGLTSAPATFQAAMNTLFADIIRKFVLVFVDDVLVYSKTLSDHVQHLKQVFRVLEQNQLFLKRNKCSFAQKSLEYLGHIISANGVATDPAKIEAVQKWPQPKNVKQLRGFLGVAGYYRKFIRQFGVICRPLTNLLKKNTAFVWSPITHDAFITLKQALVQAPVLALPDFSHEFVLETDACATGVGAVLMQRGHPLAFLSRALGPKNQALSIYDKECLAILLAIERWKTYLQHGTFVIHTDQKSLTQLGEHKFNTTIQQKAFFRLMGLQYKIVYKKGTTNMAADSLSRRPQALNAVSMVTPKWMEVVIEWYTKDAKTKQLYAELSITKTNDQGYSLVDGIIRHKGKIWLGTHVEAQRAVLTALHNSGLGGHSGPLVTYQKVNQLFSWPAMKQMVYQFVQQCSTCQQAKSEHNKYPGKLQPLPIPPEAWHSVGLDFIEGLPLSGKFDTILVVVDKFSKFGHFIPLRHPFTAASVAQLYMDNVYKLHSMPKVLISDRDKIFVSSFWQNLFRLAETTMNMSSSYHPQTDGQTERLNQCLETYLRCFVHAKPKDWSKWISLAEYWYNTSHHSALGRSPFEVLYGRKPRHFGFQQGDSAGNTDLDAWLRERALVLPVIRQHLERAQMRMKKQADKKRLERSFNVGDMVYLKLQPYVQASVVQRVSQKLGFKYFGPYKIIARVGKVSYKLQLPESSKIHPVIHVSQLKKAIHPTDTVSAELPVSLLDVSAVQPVRILEDRLVRRGGKQVPQLRVEWSGLPPSWEPLFTIVNAYPHSPAWGQAGASGEGTVTTVYLEQALKEWKRADYRQRIKEAHLSGTWRPSDG
jgi:hypothetical protein